MSAIELEDGLLARVTARVGDIPASPRPQEDRPQREQATDAVWTLPGITGPTRVSTNFGEVPAHLIRVRDRLRTREGRYLPVLRIEEYKLDEEFLQLRPEARPVLIHAPSAGGSDRRGDKISFSPAQLVAAGHGSDAKGTRADLLSSERVTIDRSLGRLSYYVFDLGQPALIRCEGLWVHSACDSE